jgi:hypothetical protein
VAAAPTRDSSSPPEKTPPPTQICWNLTNRGENLEKRREN